MTIRFIVRAPAAVRGALLRVPASWVYVEQVTHELTVTNGAYWTAAQSGAPTAGIPAKLKLWDVDGDYVTVPRHYRLPLTPKGEREIARGGPYSLAVPRRGRFEELRHSITLRDDVQEKASQALQRPGDKILALACGKGKTVVSLHAAAERKRFPLLVVVNTNALMGQWVKEILRFYNVGRVGRIQQDRCDWDGFEVSVAMLHTLVARQYPQEFYDYWRLIIFDEAHRLGANHFMQALPLFLGERWGLSATLARDDKMDKVIRLHLGRVAYENLVQPLEPSVWFIRTGTRLIENKYRFRRGRANLSKMMTDLADDENRNRLILYWIERAYAKGRTILVLGERLTQLHWLFENCTGDSKSLHVGEMDEEQRTEALTKRVVFATQHLAKEGLDRPAFDTLFILFPFGGEGRFRQSAGRILRVMDNKKPPLVMIVEDEVGILQILCNKMRNHAMKLKWKVKTIDGRTSFTPRTRERQPRRQWKERAA